MRRHLSFVLIGLGLLVFLTACNDQERTIGQPEHYLPADFATIIMTHDLSSLLAEMQQNKLLRTSSQSASLAELLARTPLMEHIQTKGISYLAFTANDSSKIYTLITQQHSDILKTDSIPDLQLEQLKTATTGTPEIQKFTLNNTAAFYSFQDSVFIASNSEVNLRNILAGQTLSAEAFQKMSRIHDKKDTAIFSKASSFQLDQSTIDDFSTWTAAELQLTSNSLVGNGVVMIQDSLSFLTVFDQQIPQQNDLETVIPVEARSAYSFTFSDANRLRKKLSTYRNGQDTLVPLPLLGTINEIGVIRLMEGQSVVLKSMDTDLTQEQWGRFVSEREVFREVQLFDWSAPTLFTSNFKPLIPSVDLTTAFQIGDFHFITENKATAEALITAIKNQRTLDRSPLFTDAFPHISNASSLLVYQMEDASSVLGRFFPTVTETTDPKLQTSYPLSLVQYSYDRNFAHLHLVIQEANPQKTIEIGVSEQYNVALEQTIQLPPQSFTNHKTRRNEVLTQDIANNLYLISDKGSMLWKKTLSEPILGKIHEVDLLKNGKRQMVFSTPHALYVLDRNGNDVGPFPLKFKDKITQPVSVFDYDNNRKYRFLVVQSNELFMYDAKGKRVKGFRFNKTSSPVVIAPQHIRIGRKDYITIAEENGKLHLLSRTGKERVGVKERFDFGKDPLFKQGTQFVLITNGREKKYISPTGKISSKPLKENTEYTWDESGRYEVALNDNQLKINDNIIELPFGLYSDPRIYVTKNKVWVTVTELQENKVYVYRKDGDLVPGFPVYGTSAATIQPIGNARFELIVPGGERSVLDYQFD